MAHMPWSAQLAAAQNLADLADLWRVYTKDEVIADSLGNLNRQGLTMGPEQMKGHMSNDWEARSAEIRLASQTGPSDKQVVTSGQKLAEIDDQSFQATLDYGTAVTEYANAHGLYKKTRAIAYMRVKGEASAGDTKLTNGEADMLADSDPMVADLYFRSELAEAKAKAAKALLEHLDRSFQYHRSVFAREGKVDGLR